ncbi:MAG: ABC transporter permease [Vicinamibacterales bacterium]
MPLRLAIRSLRRQPGFTLVAVLTLALGIGATSAIYTVVDAVLLRPLPFPDAGRLVILQERAPSFPNPISLSVLNFPDLRDRAESVERVGAWRTFTVNLTGTEDPVRLAAKMITADVLTTLRVPPLLGRAFSADDDRAGAPAVALVSEDLWRTRLGGDDDVVGRTVQLDGSPVTVVGVLPASFRLVQPADVYVPLWPWLSAQLQDRTWHPGINGLARLRDGVTLEEARREGEQIGAELERAFPDANRQMRFVATPLLDAMVQNVRTGMLLLVAAVAGVLLIACLNVAGLLLARGLARRRDVAVRTALGASRRDIGVLVFTESLVLALAGAAAGLAMAGLLVPSLMQLVGPTLPRADLVTVDGRVLAFTLALSVASAVVFGLMPAWSAARVDVREILAEGGRGQSGSRRQRRVRQTLVVVEVAMTVALLVVAGLLLRSFGRLQSVDPGFRADHLLVAGVPLSPATYPSAEVRTRAVEDLLARLGASPGVRAVAATTILPLSGTGGSFHHNLQKRPPAGPQDWILASLRAVTRTYFDTMGMPIVRGRAFGRDDRQGTEPVVIVNEAWVEQFMPGENPIGEKISLGTEYDGSLPWLTIVGVAGNVRQAPDAEPRGELYVPYEQYPDSFFERMYQNITVVLRTETPPASVAPGFRQIVRDFDADQPIVNLRTMDAVMAGAVAQPKFRTVLLGLFAAIALVLAGIGLYGVLAHGVVQRRGEFGIRLALGATPGGILGLVIGEGLRLALIGVAGGVITALLAVRLVQTMLFDVAASDAVSWLAAILSVLAAALVASWLPARRATRGGAAEALRR